MSDLIAEIELEILRRTLVGIHLDVDARERERMAEVAARVIGTFVPLPSETWPATEEISQRLAVEGCCGLPDVLSAVQVDEIVRYFRERPCFNGHVQGAGDGVARRIGAGAEAFHYGSYALEDIVCAPYLLELANDPGLLSIAGRYLGCTPTLYSLNAWWSFSGHPQRAPTAQSFHRDLDDLKFCTLFVFLTDVDEAGGPHAYVRRTHRVDSLDREIAALRADMLQISSVRDALASGALFRGQGYALDAAIEAMFGHLVQIFTGRAGRGLIADTYGFHKGVPPQAGTRLMFWARYGTQVNLGPYRRPVAASLVEGRIARDDRARFINRAIIQP